MSNEPKAGPGLDPELLAAYVDQRLSPEQRAAVEAQLAADPDSHAVLVETMKALDADAAKVPGVPEVPKVPGVPKVPKVRWAIAGGLLAAAAALLLVVEAQPDWWVRLRGGDPQFTRLVAAVGEERYIEARLTGGFRPGPLRPTTRAAGDLAQQNLALLSAARELQQRAKESPTGEHLHLWGVAQVLLGDLDGAVETIQAAIQHGDSPEVRSDLSAALLARARGGRPADLPAALEHAEVALNSRPDLPEALFNRALALEYLQLREEAIGAWEKFQGSTSDPQWIELARRRLEALRSKRAGIDPAAFEGIPWPTDLELSTPGAMAAMKRSLMSTGMVPACNDTADERFVKGLVEAHARASGDRTLIDAFRLGPSTKNCEGLRAFGIGLRAYEIDDISGARRAFVEARDKLGPGHPFALEAAFHIAHVDSLERRFGSAETALNEVSRAAIVAGYLSTAAKAEWMAGVTRLSQSDYRGALPRLQRASSLAASAAEPLLEGRILNQIADAHEYLGDTGDAWQSRIRALDIADTIPSWRLRNSTYASLGTIATRRQLSWAALTFQRLEAATVHDKRASPLYLLSLLGQVDTAITLGRLNEASSLSADAASALRLLADDPRFPTFSARVALKSSQVHLVSGDVRSGRASLAMIDRKSLDNRESQRIEYFCQMSAVAALEGNALEAASYAREAVSVLEDRRSAERPTVFGAPDIEAVRNSIELALQAKLPKELALELVLAEHGLAWPVFRQSPTAIPHGAAMVVYRVMRNDTLAWLVDGEGIKERLLGLPRSRAVTLALTLKQAAVSGDHECCWEDAFQRLFGDWGGVLRDYNQIGVIPDWPLDSVPFAALRDPSTHEYLIENAAVLMGVPADLQAAARRPRTMTAVAAELPGEGLPPLPGARAEAEQVATLYEASQLIAGSSATLDNFRLHSNADVVHVAAHAVVDRADGRRSRILLADGPIFGEELQSFDFSGTEVVVLAACQTGRPDNRPSSPFTLASQVLAAGAQFVVATTANVDDELAREFFVRIHELLASGASPVETVRRTQAAFLREDAHRSEAGRFALWTSIVLVAR